MNTRKFWAHYAAACRKYKGLSKGMRFCIQYCTAPIWLPIAISLALLALCVLGPISVAIEAWEEFK